MSLAILFHFLCTQHVSDINIFIIRSLRLRCWITTSVVLFSVRCVLEIWCGWFWVVVLTDVVIQQHSRKLFMMDILMSETCWVHKKWHKIASDIKLVFYSSAITMMHGPINITLPFTICTRLGEKRLISARDYFWRTSNVLLDKNTGSNKQIHAHVQCWDKLLFG